MKKLFSLNILFVCFVHLFAQTYNNITVYTPKGTPIEAKILTSGELSNATKAAWKSQTLAEHPNATFLADATNTYNCHGYAWHISEGQVPIVWINEYDNSLNPNVYKYWTDGSYIQVCNESDADKVHYYSGDHSAIISTVVSGKYESKWGPNIRIRHDPTDVPSIYNAQYRNYYISTKITGDISNLCSGTRTFTVKNISGATYTWTYSSSLSVVGATNTNQLTVQLNGNASGAAWAEVQISTPCSGSSVTNRINFTVGAPQSSNIILWSSTNSTAIGNPVGFVAGYPPDNRCQIQATQWQVSMDASLSAGNFPCESDNETSKNIFFQSTGTAYVQASIQNGCGWSDWSTGVPITVNSGYYFIISPNPASGQITVTQKDKTTAEIAEIKIFDNTGNLKQQSKYTRGTKQAQLNTFGLKSGIYFIEISGGQYKERQQLVIQK